MDLAYGQNLKISSFEAFFTPDVYKIPTSGKNEDYLLIK